jgi:hypothetical protein
MELDALDLHLVLLGQEALLPNGIQAMFAVLMFAEERTESVVVAQKLFSDRIEWRHAVLLGLNGSQSPLPKTPWRTSGSTNRPPGRSGLYRDCRAWFAGEGSLDHRGGAAGAGWQQLGDTRPIETFVKKLKPLIQEFDHRALRA